MAKPPKVVYVGAADYEIRLKKKFDLLGETLNNDTTIVVKREQSPACMRDTVLHEVIHAVLWCSGYSYRLEHEKEEKLVRALTPWLLALLRDNPELIEYLIEDAWEPVGPGLDEDESSQSPLET